MKRHKWESIPTPVALPGLGTLHRCERCGLYRARSAGDFPTFGVVIGQGAPGTPRWQPHVDGPRSRTGHARTPPCPWEPSGHLAPA